MTVFKDLIIQVNLFSAGILVELINAFLSSCIFFVIQIARGTPDLNFEIQ